MSVANEMRVTLARLREDLAKLGEKPMNQVKTQSSLIYKKRQEDYTLSSIKNSLARVEDLAWDLTKTKDTKVIEILNSVMIIKQSYSLEDKKRLIVQIQKIEEILEQIKEPKTQTLLIPKTLNVPDAIKEEVNADLSELSRCFETGLYRSSIILCGRILEVALHRKYYDITGQDILETQPGIGLGKLVAKLYEKDALFDPGLNEQIHLINKVRIHSVHKKEELFRTTKEQTYATILYTLDIVKRIFP